jgi:hypothetical protein
MHLHQKGAAETVNEAILSAAGEALCFARQFREAGEVADACDMYDTAFMAFAGELGESHAVTLEVQREYGMYLTVMNMLARTSRRRLN